MRSDRSQQAFFCKKIQIKADIIPWLSLFIISEAFQSEQQQQLSFQWNELDQQKQTRTDFGY